VPAASRLMLSDKNYYVIARRLAEAIQPFELHKLDCFGLTPVRPRNDVPSGIDELLSKRKVRKRSFCSNQHFGRMFLFLWFVSFSFHCKKEKEMNTKDKLSNK